MSALDFDIFNSNIHFGQMSECFRHVQYIYLKSVKELLYILSSSWKWHHMYWKIFRYEANRYKYTC